MTERKNECYRKLSLTIMSEMAKTNTVDAA
jgi:hypothetical protein